MTLRRRRRPRFVRALSGGAVTSALVVACAQDWGIRESGDAGGGPGEAGVDAPVDRDTSAPDAPGVVDAGVDVDARAGDCKALSDDVDAKRKEARRCVLSSGHCTLTVLDQCDCEVVIAINGSPAVTAYKTAVTALKNSGCERGCGASCPTTTPRNCLVNAASEVLCVP